MRVIAIGICLLMLFCAKDVSSKAPPISARISRTRVHESTYNAEVCQSGRSVGGGIEAMTGSAARRHLEVSPSFSVLEIIVRIMHRKQSSCTCPSRYLATDGVRRPQQRPDLIRSPSLECPDILAKE